ncbi:hypothetical protein [Kitasatospora aureofaciens]|uniref:hypothetical protein n=1 Tax=Kitasatospora aureofaciens TaxID=1894 RepID=UPI0036F451C6
MAEIEIPDPDPTWGPAPSLWSAGGGEWRRNANPAFQTSLWEYAIGGAFDLVAGLSIPMALLAARLRLTVEHGWEDLGDVEAAMFAIQKIDFALSRTAGNPLPGVYVWVAKAQHDQEAALDLLLAALGADRDALTFLREVTPEGTTYQPCA